MQSLNMADLTGSFLAASTKHVVTIIDEYHVPNDLKTISPIPMEDVPEEEREELYIHNGLVIKFATDPSGIDTHLCLIW